MNFTFISGTVAYALSLCKFDWEMSNDPRFRCRQILRSDVTEIELEPAGPYNNGYQLRGMIRAGNRSKPFNTHYWVV